MKVAIVGSRSITNREWVHFHLDMNLCDWATRTIDDVLDQWPTIMSGGAKGVDTIVEEWAKAEGLDFIKFKPYHMIDSGVEYEPRFFFTRNKQLVDQADRVVCFWDGKSNGTADVIRYAKKVGKPLLVIDYNAEEAEKVGK